MTEPLEDAPKVTGIRPWFVFLCMGVTGFLVWGYMRHREAAKLTALIETITAKQEPIGKAMQAAGHLEQAPAIAARAQATLGPEFTQELTRRGGAIVSHVSASGHIPASSSPLQLLPILPAVSEAEMASWQAEAPQKREGGKPSLTTAHLRFTPEDGPSIGWENHEEQFRLAMAEWRTSGDGLRAAVRLTRTVNGATEEIPLNQADFYVTPDEVQRLSPLPRFSLTLGVGFVQGRPKPVLLMEKPFSRSWSLVTGYANGGSVAGVKYTWGAK